VVLPSRCCYGGFKKAGFVDVRGGSSNIAILCRSRDYKCFEGPSRFAGGWKLFQKAIHGIREIVYGTFPIYYTKLFVFKAALRSILIHTRIYGVFKPCNPQSLKKWSGAHVNSVICQRKTTDLFLIQCVVHVSAIF
jgi:hypothetical protein